MEPYLLAIDIGTSSTRAIAYDRQLNPLGTIARTYAMQHPQPGWCEQDPKVLLKIVLDVIKKSIQQQGSEPEAIVFSSVLHSLMAVDEGGKPLTHLLLWADNRSQPQAEKLRHSAEGKALYQQSGTPIHPMSPLCKLLWFRENSPEIKRFAKYWMSIKEYIFWQLTGERVIDHSVASATGIFDIHRLMWSEKAMELTGISIDQLSKPVSIRSPFFLKEYFSSKLSFSKKIPLIIGGGDGCLANWGAGVTTPGTLALTLGTSGAARITLPKPYLDPHMRTFCYLLDEHHYITGGAVNNAGIAFQWLVENMLGLKTNEKTYALLLEEAGSIPPGAEGVRFIPYLLGERAPFWDDRSGASFTGLRIHHKRGHMVRAVIEGVLSGLAAIIQILQEISPIQQIHAGGGLAKSDFWMQLTANITGIPVVITSEPEHTALGAALIGAEVLGWDAVNSSVFAKQYFPNQEEHIFYTNLQ